MKSFDKIIKSWFGGWVQFLVFLISILGLIFTFMSDRTSVIISLITFCLVLLIILIYILFILYKISSIKSGKIGYDTRGFFIRYEQVDNNKIIYETYKPIQVTAPFLTEADYKFNWTGDIMPEISSDLQEVQNITTTNGAYDKAVLKFDKAAMWNQSLVLNFKAICNDTSGTSEPYVAALIAVNTDIVVFRVILRHKPEDFCANGRVLKNKEGCPKNKEIQIGEVAFDKQTMSYEHTIPNPEVGYVYSLHWDK